MIWLPRTTDNSTYFAQSLEIRGIESRLYIFLPSYPTLLFITCYPNYSPFLACKYLRVFCPQVSIGSQREVLYLELLLYNDKFDGKRSKNDPFDFYTHSSYQI